MNFNFLKSRNNVLIAIAAVGIVATGVLIYADSSKGFSLANLTSGLFAPAPKEIGQKAVDYINNSKLAGATTVALKDATEESGLIKIKIDVGGKDFDSWVTKDGKFLFANPPIEMTDKKQEEQKSAEIKKSDKPVFEAYIVSRCPFGLQMQRAMAEAVKEKPELAQYIKARYIGDVSSDGRTITAMHGEVEAKENLRQICIRDEQPEKYWPYVVCQMKKAGTENTCATSTGVDVAKMNACVADPARGVAFAKKDFELANKYGASGSPTLILGEATIDESKYGGRSSDGVKNMVCAGFNTPAGFCSEKLNVAPAASSFFETYASASGSTGGDASCGN